MGRLLFLKPSDIHYSQDSISNTFGKSTVHSDKYIGETLDDLINGTVKVNNIPNISVFIHNNKWFTTDNRRLWVFRKAEEFGILRSIPVSQNLCIDLTKLTPTDDGLTVRVRRNNPGGQTWRRLSGEGYTNPYQNYTESHSPNRMTDTCDMREHNIFRHKYDDGSSSYFKSLNEIRPYSEFANYFENSKQSYS
ncbi:unnamed protein product [Mytilus coruscus]|uniref:Uncharacterized protein n=1 Tax=Mytilus coruscus TaxID=42192 RepID=A0A6J8DZ12_MYTCO|nr:unnamed protein product [Mytilus coruscus]